MWFTNFSFGFLLKQGKNVKISVGIVIDLQHQKYNCATSLQLFLSLSGLPSQKTRITRSRSRTPTHLDLCIYLLFFVLNLEYGSCSLYHFCLLFRTLEQRGCKIRHQWYKKPHTWRLFACFYGQPVSFIADQYSCLLKFIIDVS